MRLISLVVALLIVAFIVHKQLGGKASDPGMTQEDSTPEVLKIPTKPEDLEKFEKDLDTFVKDQEEETSRRIEEAEK